MKKILHVISQYPDKTGSGIFLRALVNEGEKAGYTQAVVSASTKNMDVVKFKEEIVEYKVEFNSESLDFNIVGMSDIMPYPSTKYSQLTNDKYNLYIDEFEKTILRAVDELRPDIILSHHIWLTTSIITRIKGKAKLIVFSQGTELRQLNLSPRFKDEVILAAKNIDLVCALNEYQKEEISSKFNIDRSKIKVFGVGFNKQYFYKDKDDFINNDFVFIGKIAKSKGVECLIRAFKMIKGKHKLYIIGSGLEENYMKNLSMGDNRIVFTGHLTQEEAGNILRKSKVFVLPSFYEGLPLVIMEALSCRCSVIVSDIKGIKPWISDEINNSKAIKYLPMPRVNVDIPLDEDIDVFIEDLAQVMKEAIDEKIDFDSIENNVKSRSWEGYFKKLEKEFI